MKKIVFIVALVIFFSSLSFAKNRFFVSAGAAAVWPVDSGFRDYYGSLQFSPELKAGYTVFKRFYLWLGYSFFNSSYSVPVVLDESKVGQHFLALGVGWETRRSRRLQFDFFAAVIAAAFRENAFGETVKELAPGLQVGTGARYFISSRVYIGTAISFSAARITLAESTNSLDGTRQLGGLRFGVSVGARF